jgi:uncharacterized protein (DUF1015 family)
MAIVAPLPGLRYDPARAGELRDLIAPPYDVISPAQQEALYARSPYNVVRLILPRDADRGAASAAALRDWMAKGVLARDAAPALYFYTQTYTLPDGTTRTREGVLCRLGLEEFSSGVVRPHERTFPGPKQDRLSILRATGAYLSPIFGLYSRPNERLRDVLGVGPRPDVEIRAPEGEIHRLWIVTDAGAIARVAGALAAETIYIADGHHRYETALAYRAERGGEPGDAGTVLAYLANMEEEGLVILPTHRLVQGPLGIETAALEARLAECFAVEQLDGAPRPSGAIDCVLPDRSWRLRPKPAAAAMQRDEPAAVRELGVAILRNVLLEGVLACSSSRLAFTHDDREAVDAVRAGQASAAFLLNAPSMAAVRAVCLSGAVMPEKSTYFYPKLADGLVFDLID